MNKKSTISAGDVVKISTDGGMDRVDKVVGFTTGSRIVPDGWLVLEDGSSVNPNRCSIYTGATSFLSTS